MLQLQLIGTQEWAPLFLRQPHKAAAILITVRRLPFYLFLLIPATGLAGLNFAERIIDAGFNVEQPVLIANLTDDDERQIVLAGRDEHHVQRLAIYSLGQAASSEPLLSLVPGPNLIAYDVGRFGDQDALLFIEPGRILRYDLDSGKFVEVVKMRTIYGQNRSGDIVPIDFFRDLNLDDRDDLIAPDTAGYRASTTVDLFDAARLVDNLDNVHFFQRAMVCLHNWCWSALRYPTAPR